MEREREVPAESEAHRLVKSSFKKEESGATVSHDYDLSTH